MLYVCSDWFLYQYKYLDINVFNSTYRVTFTFSWNAVVLVHFNVGFKACTINNCHLSPGLNLANDTLYPNGRAGW